MTLRQIVTLWFWFGCANAVTSGIMTLLAVLYGLGFLAILGWFSSTIAWIVVSTINNWALLLMQDAFGDDRP